MKRTLSINLAGYVYHIDDDAYAKFNQYLAQLEKNLKSENDRQDILADIEARISELLNERLGTKRQVVTIEDINFIIAIMGEPDIITGDGSKSESHEAFGKYRYRRMYRDPGNRILGGVCSGLAAYWNLDPLIIRTVFVVFFILGGSGLIIYLILWIIIPEAQTTAQKLEMRGEAVTVGSIKDFIKKEFENMKHNFSKK